MMWYNPIPIIVITWLFLKNDSYRKRINDHNVYFFTKKSLQDDHHHLMSNDMLHNPSHNSDVMVLL